jgi:hypothetical protein
LHGLGTGSDIKSHWMQYLTAACVMAVLAAIAARTMAGDAQPRARTGILAAVVLAAVVLVAWTAQGPLAKGWARRAGTPPSVLNAFTPKATRSRPAIVREPDPFAHPVDAHVSGRVDSGTSTNGTAVAELHLRLHGQVTGVLGIRLGGSALAGGGLALRHSAVTFGPAGRPHEYSGRITSLDNNRMSALVGSSEGRALRLNVALVLGTRTASGRLRVTPVGGGEA